MAEIWKGKSAADAMLARMRGQSAALRSAGVVPTICVFRVGERPDDLAYERGVVRRCAEADVELKQVVLPQDVSQEAFDRAFLAVNRDPAIHGILLFRPLPPQLDGERARRMLDPAKDIDGCTDASLAGVFANSGVGFAPCTAEACLTLLRHYGVALDGKRAVVVGRSAVIGRPAAMLLLRENATVTVAHTHTKGLSALCREADILIVAAGKMGLIGAEYVRPNQVVIDVGIHGAPDGSLHGDVRFDEVEPIVGAVTPVPGGVGAMTTALLCKHVIRSAKKSAR